MADTTNRSGDKMAGVSIASGASTAAIPKMILTDASGAPTALSGGALPAGTDRSGVIIAGGTAQDVAPANAVRTGMIFQNTSDTAMWLTESGVTAANGTGYSVAPGLLARINTNKRISLFCSTTSKAFASTEY